MSEQVGSQAHPPGSQHEPQVTGPDMLRSLLLIRRFETRAGQLYAEGRFSGSLHLAIGQEAVAVGACATLGADDFITSTHRGHHHCLARGGDARQMMAELFGRRTGYCGGRGGSMHIADATVGILGANGIVGANLPIAAGAALACQVRGRGVVVCFFGDGAVAEGAFHEALNLASLWKLPVVYVCENNGYGQLSTAASQSPVENVAVRAGAYGIVAESVDGNDAIAMRDAALRATARARRGEGPTLIEAVTFRIRGHYEGTPAKFLDPSKIAEWQVRDPIAILRAQLDGEGVLDESRWTSMNEEVEEQVEEAVRFAESSEWPVASDLYTHLVAQ